MAEEINESTAAGPQEEQEEKGMRPIWFFVGLVLLIMGTVITLAGVYYLFYPSKMATAVPDVHPNLWWGGIMVIAGLIFYLTTKNSRVT